MLDIRTKLQLSQVRAMLEIPNLNDELGSFWNGAQRDYKNCSNYLLDVYFKITLAFIDSTGRLFGWPSV